MVIVGAVVIAAVLVVLSGLWVAFALVAALSRDPSANQTGDGPPGAA